MYHIGLTVAIGVFLFNVWQTKNAVAPSGGASQIPALVVDSLAGEVRLAATFHPRNFSGIWGGLIRVVSEYHFLVWNDGRASREALFVTSVSDSQVVAALGKIGARPGNNLTMDTWDKRHEAKHPAPQVRIAGTSLTIHILWENSKNEISISELLDDSGGGDKGDDCF